MISIVCYLWQGDNPARVFLPEHVNTLAAAVRRTLTIPHRFICVADQSFGLGPFVEFVRTPEEARRAGELKTLEGSRFPSCYRRLWTFSRDAGERLGEHILAVDIDLVPVRDFSNLVRNAGVADFIGWRPLASWGHRQRVGGGIYYLHAGAHPEVWEEFADNPRQVQAFARARGFRGSDQAIISNYLGGKCSVWPEPSGIYSIRDLQNGKLPLPADATLVQFNGPTKPWHHVGHHLGHLDWVQQYWHGTAAV